MDALTPGLGGSRGKETGLEGMEGTEAAIGSALGSLPRPGLAIGGGGMVGDNL